MISIAVIVHEKKRGEASDTLKTKPLLVLLQILVNQVLFFQSVQLALMEKTIRKQILFYAWYLLVMFTIDVAASEPFSWWQVFSSLECSFFIQRGILTCLGLIVTFLFSGAAFSGIVHDTTKVLSLFKRNIHLQFLHPNRFLHLRLLTTFSLCLSCISLWSPL